MEQRKIQRIVFMPPDKIGTDRREFLLQTLKQNRDKLHSQKDGYSYWCKTTCKIWRINY